MYHDDAAADMSPPCAPALPVASGGLAAGAWFIVIDAVLLRTGAGPPLGGMHFVPAGMATLALTMALVGPYRVFGGNSDNFLSSRSTSALQCARLWLFGVMLLALTAIYSSVALGAAMADGESARFGQGGDETHRWMGAALALHAVATGAATSLWVMRRVQVAAGAF